MSGTDFLEIKCNHCGRSMRMKRVLLLKRGLCNYCGKKMALPAELQNEIDNHAHAATAVVGNIDVECPVCSRQYILKKSSVGQITRCSYCLGIFLVPPESGIAPIAISPEMQKLTEQMPLFMRCPTCNEQAVVTSDEYGFNGVCLKCGTGIKCHDYPLFDVVAVPIALADSAIGELPVQMISSRWSLGEIVYYEAAILIEVLAVIQKFQSAPRKSFSPFTAQWTSDFISRTVLLRLSNIASRREGALYLTLKPFNDIVLQCVFSDGEEGCEMNTLRQVREQLFEPIPADLETELYLGFQAEFEKAVIQEYSFKALFSATSGTGDLASTGAIVRRLTETCGLSTEEAIRLEPTFRPSPPIDLGSFKIYR